MTDWKFPVIDIGPFGDGDVVTRERIVADVDWAGRPRCHGGLAAGPG